MKFHENTLVISVKILSMGTGDDLWQKDTLTYCKFCLTMLFEAIVFRSEFRHYDIWNVEILKLDLSVKLKDFKVTCRLQILQYYRFKTSKYQNRNETLAKRAWRQLAKKIFAIWAWAWTYIDMFISYYVCILLV